MSTSEIQDAKRPSKVKWFAAGALLTGLIFSAVAIGPSGLSEMLGMQAKADQRTIIESR